MCGFAGIVGRADINEQILKKIGAAIAHRGPDEDGLMIKDGVGLIHHRLSILDLDGSQQPMSICDDRYHIVFNGQIYNYQEIKAHLVKEGVQFNTKGDTEVILRLYQKYGEKLLSYLRGMFSFAIWDDEKKSLFCARDHYGQKPFFYRFKENVLVFGSEIKAILTESRKRPKMDINTVYHYLGLRFCPGDSTLFEDVKKIPPGSYMIFQNGSIQIKRYWDIHYTDKMRASEEDISEELHEILKETIQLHLISDVTVGTFLSGGVDSSIVTAMASRQSEKCLPTFSVGSEDEDFSELPYASHVAEIYNTDHHQKIVTPDIIDLIPDLVWHMEEPGDPHGVGIYTLSKFARQFVKVVLGGDGGDEMFAGYTRYRGQQILQTYSFLPFWFRKFVIEKFISIIPETFGYYSLATKLGWLNEASFIPENQRFYHNLTFFRFSDERKKYLLTKDAFSKIEDRNSGRIISRYFDASNSEDLIDKLTYTETMTRMPEHYLLIADRLSMAHGLELRVPLIDYKFSEFVAKIPSSMKMNWKRQKHIFKNVGQKYLSKNFLDRTKRGFSYPMGHWFRGPLRNLVDNVFRKSELVKDEIFNGAYLEQLKSEHNAGTFNHNFRIWMIINFEVWYRMFIKGWSKKQLQNWIIAQK